ncbi:MAG TPA: ribonuclease E/G, partial [Fibrobacteria bacterium]|nr:ribonuclease E/G [Fibrobacteria bacterium]
MAKHILIDSYFGLVRTAIAQGGRLLDYYEESPDQGRSKGNIYQGTIKKVDAHIQAAFVRYGGGRDGFLPLRDIPFRSEDKGGKGKGGEAPIGQGDSLLVQVVKDEVGSKGAALTTKLSLSGRYLVYMPDREGEGGISSRITDEERAVLKKTLSELQIPEGSSVILRTAALGKPAEELQADLDRLIEAYREIAEQAHDRKEPGLIYREAPPALRYLREYYTPDVEKIWVNREDVFEQCRQFFYLYEPKSAAKVFLSKDGPLMFQKLGLEAEVDRLTARKVSLPSGANFVIDQTEALVAIDVNSAKSRDRDGSGSRGERSGNGSGEGEEEGGDRKGGEGRRRGESAALRKEKDLEDTVFAINMEAGLEIARQLRLRDLGGIIVVDFIDMEEDSHRRKLEEAMRRALSADKAKVKVYDISPLGLMQISRQRLRKAGAHFSKTPCGTCQGRGWQSSPAVAAFAALRKLEERLQGRRVTGTLTLTAPPAVVNQLMNEFRAFVIALEERHGVGVRVLADAKAEESVLSVQGGEGDAARPVQGPRGAKAEDEDAGVGESRPEGHRKEGQHEAGRDKGRKERSKGRRAPREVEPAPVEISLEIAAPEPSAEPPREAEGFAP